jgi:hypothetical protein
MNNILDDSSSYEDAPPSKYTLPKNKKLAFLRQLLTGTGMFYVDKKNRFRWFYFIIFSYALFGILNMICWANFRIGLSFLDHFHNKMEVGALSLFISIFIAYPIALIHLNWLINKQWSRF